ncbi:CLUMA_CG016706, isoform A [Clunio marinus]|uniref:CLUMA_CG016706, isoform A n=1 Tax=Clunio marinus TaxID=568069 RepID=A0A1J1IT28_9DIPT|nr:CLUMA_CG016706, isoform A [Clunio marinus]
MKGKEMKKSHKSEGSEKKTASWLLASVSGIKIGFLGKQRILVGIMFLFLVSVSINLKFNRALSVTQAVKSLKVFRI